MKCGSKKPAGKKGYMMGGMAKKEMPMKKSDMPKKAAKGGVSNMMLAKMGRNMAKAKAKG